MYMDLLSSFIGLSTSNSESELEREKILLSFFFFLNALGLSSSVFGGVSVSLPDAGTLMLPLGFFLALIRDPFIFGLGAVDFCHFFY